MPWPKGKQHTPEHKKKCIDARRKNNGLSRSKECRDKISKSLGGNPKSDAHKEALRKVAPRSWRGSETGDEFAAVLCPAGFVREFLVYYGDKVMPVGYGGLRQRFFRLDFAHVEAKINIELDGPRHKALAEEDQSRDKVLKNLGWKVIRINHGA